MDEDPVGAARRSFRERFGRSPEGVVFAPGRVNLIGEHVDYCGLPVLPAALARGVALAFAAREGARVRCLSTEPGYGETGFELGGTAPPDFGRYLSSAGAGLTAGGWTGGAPLVGFDGLLASNLPPAAGLSSSSALVVAAALALLRLASGRRLRAEEAPRLARDLAEAEHGVAIQGGAMDQSICLGARTGHALSIRFEPPGWIPVPVDGSRFSFLVAFGGRRADKGGAAGKIFDARVREAREALSLARRALRDPGGYPALVAEHSPEELRAVGGRLPRPLDRRFRHIVTEAHRTATALDRLGQGDAAAFGALLDASHDSLRRDYEVSTPELDALVAEARRAGALGARLTGAGFGGSAVILCAPRERSAVRTHLARRFYIPRRIPHPERTHLFDAAPSGPAALLPE